MRLLLKVGILTLLLTSLLFGHDLYLVADIKGAKARACARIGEDFPESTSAVTPDRLNSFSYRDSEGKRVPLAGPARGKQFCVPFVLRTSTVIEMTVQPRFIKLDAKEFGPYIAGEGLVAVQKRRRDDNRDNAPGRELYSRYAKLLAGPASEVATKPLGHTLEIVPNKDPRELSPGEPLPITVLFQGRPLPDVQVSAVYSGARLHGHSYPVSTRTDSEGRAVLKLDRVGLWYARLIYMVPAQNDPEVDWRSYFATLTFEIP